MPNPPRPKGGTTDERGKCEDRKGATEELSTAICLKTLGIVAEDTQDSLGEEGVMLFQPQAHWYSRLWFFFCFFLGPFS